MCGIAGIVDFRDAAGVSEPAIRQMTSRLKHRGPDGEGFHIERFAGFGHRRLGVIDLEGGAQPMTNEDGSLWVIYNGEIYNFANLAADLRGMGHRFATRCDTEVILHAYEQWGASCLDRMNGMFAFALWDSRARRLFLARDRLGIKPLFVVKSPGRLVFASELQALLPALAESPSLDPFGLSSYFLAQYVPAPRTIFRGVEKLPPGHAALFDEGGFKQWRWWSQPGEDAVSPANGAPERLRELLDDSVRMRLVSDVPLGAFLSGGIDSCSVVGMMARHASAVSTFQVAFEDPPGYDETRYATLASEHFRTKHHRLVMKPSDLKELLPGIARGLGEPVADPALIPTYMVSKLAREHVTVVLTGEGADELFGGYLRYSLERLARPWNLAPGFVRRLTRKVFSRLPRAGRFTKAIDALNAPAGAARHLAWVEVLPVDDLAVMLPGISVRDFRRELMDVFATFFSSPQGSVNPLGCTLRCDLATWLPDDLLAKVDYMSMAHGLEARVPFLDYRMVEWALSLPDEARIRGLTRKAVLKDAAATFVPEAIRKRPKWGFTLPLNEWFRGPLRDFLRDSLASSSTRLPASPQVVREWVEEHESGKQNHSEKLFSLLMITLWLEGVR